MGSEKVSILIVDDEENIRNQLLWGLSDDYEVLLSEDGSDVMDIVRKKRPNLILLDLHLPPKTETPNKGLDILYNLIEDHEVKVIVISGDGDRRVALKAIDMGACDYILKPINLNELKILIKRALYVQRLEEENRYLNNELTKKYSFENIIGCSSQMKEIFSIIKKVSDTDATVLITGENGTGKELIARTIHYCSPRKKGPFQVINCGAIPEQLLESELFGYERGSFTGAYERKIGKIELADKGTLFLDEIGELSLTLQVKLLRFLQEHEIERIGGTKRLKVNVRVIAATNKDLKKAIKDGGFREDLFYRLNVIPIEIPPLREREDDIILLAKYFLDQTTKKVKKKVKGFSKSAEQALRQYSWPGNVRELKNRIERAVILCSKNFISEKDLGLNIKRTENLLSLKQAKSKLEKEYISKALEMSQGNITKAAKIIDVNRMVFTRLVKKYHINKEFFKMQDFGKKIGENKNSYYR